MAQPRPDTLTRLQVEDLAVHFHGRRVFRPVAFELQRGNALAVCGPNGSGKTTLLRALAGQLRPTEGRVTYHSASASIPDERWPHYLSWMAPGLELPTELTVADTARLHFRLKPCSLTGGWREVLERLELDFRAQTPLGRLSSGQQQRLRVGLALWTAAPLLLLDEPTAFLDAPRAQFLLDLIDSHNAANQRIYLLASNLPHELERLPLRLDLQAASSWA